MKFITEFKEFAIRGNMLEMAVGIIIGVAFNKIVTSLVQDIFMPVFGVLVGRVSFESLHLVIQNEHTDEAGRVVQDFVAIRYGAFVQTFIDFLIIAFTVFLVIQFFHRLKKKAEDEKDISVPTPKDIALLSEIRDLLNPHCRFSSLKL
jgi:large conductance mechanosensitive channel